MPGRVPLSVSVRIRPLPESEQAQVQQTSHSKDPSSGIIETRGKLVELMDAEKQHLSKFTVDNVFPASSTSADVFSTIGEPLLEHVLSGYNACCFAYGQTGSGKTHNMLGLSTAADNKGLIPQCVERIFSAMKQKENIGSKISVFISFIEIYQEHVRDLGKAVSRLQETEGLKQATSAGSRPSSGRPPRPPSAATRRTLEDLAQESLDIVEDSEGNTSVRGLTYIEVNSAAEAATLLAGGTSLRATAATEQNDVSSRSHTIFSISAINYSNNAAFKGEHGGEATLAGCLHMVDLAGSEDLRRSGSGSEEQRLAEARSINSSLSTLGKVVMLLSSGAASGGTASHIPFRDSKLTRILKDSLSGNCLTHLLACVYPTARNCRECLSTLQFALRCTEIKTSPVVNTITQSSTKCSCTSNELVAELTQQVSDLQRELDNTHSHYQKLLEGSKSGQVDYGPIERAGDSAVEGIAASPGVEGAAAGQSGPGSPKHEENSKNTLEGQADAADTSQPVSHTASFEKWREKAQSKRQGVAQQQEQALLTQITSLESQVDRVTWKWNDASTQLRTLREDHAKLLQYSSKQSGKAAESQRVNAATIRKLNGDLQQASDDRRTEITALTLSAADEKDRLLEQLDVLTRHNTQLIKSIPEMFNKHQTDSDKAARKSEAKESELRAWFAATIAEMEESTARRVEFAEASTARAKQEGETQAQDLQHQLNIAIERFETTEREWRKEAKVLWRYCDRLAALVDLMATGGIIKPAKPPPSTLPRKPSFVPPLTSTISAAASRDSNGATAVESSEKGRDPGRMNAASLKRTLEAVSAVESYLANSGRIDFQASNEGEGEVDTTEDDSKPTPSPGWKLALDKVNAELRATQQECTTLQKENSRLQEELVDCLPERNARKKALKQEEQDAARVTNLQMELANSRDLFKKEQEGHLATRCALESAQRRLRARQLDSHHVPPHTSQSTLRPCSAPLSRPANIYQYPAAMSAIDKSSGNSQMSQWPQQVPQVTANAPTIRSKYGLSSYRPASSLRHSSRANSGTNSKKSPAQGSLKASYGVQQAWPSSESCMTNQRGSSDPLYNRHACTIVEDLVSTSQATIQAHKAQLRAKSARPYMRNAQPV